MPLPSPSQSASPPPRRHAHKALIGFLSICAIIGFFVSPLWLSSRPLPANSKPRLGVLQEYVFGEADEGAGGDKFPLHPLWGHPPEDALERNELLVRSALAGTKWTLRLRRKFFGEHRQHDWLSQYNASELSALSSSLDPPLFFDEGLSFSSNFVAIPEEATLAGGLVTPRVCLQRRDDTPLSGVLFVGHSHVRFVATMLCAMLKGANCHRMGNKNANFTLLRFGEAHSSAIVPVVYLQTRYNSSLGLPLLFQDASVQAILPRISHIVYGRGAWDQLYKDSVPNALQGEIVSEILRMTEAIPSISRVIVYATHYQHVYSNPSKPALWHAHIRQCKSNARQRISRSIGLCAAKALGDIFSSRQSTYNSSINNTPTLYPAREVLVEPFDVWFPTRDQFAGVSSDLAGHHFMEGALEGLVQLLMRRHLCPWAPRAGGGPAATLADPISIASRSISPQALMAMACRRVAEASESPHANGTLSSPLAACSCHRPSFASRAPCDELAIHLARPKQW